MSLRKKIPLSDERRIPTKSELRKMEEDSWRKFAQETATVRIDLTKSDDRLGQSENFKEIGSSNEGVIIHDPVSEQNVGILIGQRKWKDKSGQVYDAAPRKARLR